MNLKKNRWSRVYESSEEELMEHLQARNVQAIRRAAEAGTAQRVEPSEHDTTIWCAEGSLAVRIGTESVSLQPGDTLHISAQTPCELHAGLTGYVCYFSE